MHLAKSLVAEADLLVMPLNPVSIIYTMKMVSSSTPF